MESPGHAAVGKDVGEVVGLPAKGVKVVDSLDQVLSQGEVVIEFSHPEPSLAHLSEVADANRAMVLGTTGFSPPQIAEIHALASRAPSRVRPQHERRGQLTFRWWRTLPGCWATATTWRSSRRITA